MAEDRMQLYSRHAVQMQRKRHLQVSDHKITYERMAGAKVLWTMKKYENGAKPLIISGARAYIKLYTLTFSLTRLWAYDCLMSLDNGRCFLSLIEIKRFKFFATCLLAVVKLFVIYHRLFIIQSFNNEKKIMYLIPSTRIKRNYEYC